MGRKFTSVAIVETMFVMVGGHGRRTLSACPTLIVDAAATDDGDGSSQHPFSSLPAAMEACHPGFVVAVRPGVYSVAGGVLKLKPGVSLLGQGAESTIIDGDLIDEGPGQELVSIRKLRFGHFHLSRSSPTDAPKGAIELIDCQTRDLVVSYGGRELATDKLYDLLIQGNQIDGSLAVRHGIGLAKNVICSNSISGNVELVTRAGATNLLVDNHILGTFVDSSESLTTAMSGNFAGGEPIDAGKPRVGVTMEE